MMDLSEVSEELDSGRWHTRLIELMGILGNLGTPKLLGLAQSLLAAGLKIRFLVSTLGEEDAPDLVGLFEDILEEFRELGQSLPDAGEILETVVQLEGILKSLGSTPAFESWRKEFLSACGKLVEDLFAKAFELMTSRESNPANDRAIMRIFELLEVIAHRLVDAGVAAGRGASNF
jgi:hypothetical protein